MSSRRRSEGKPDLRPAVAPKNSPGLDLNGNGIPDTEEPWFWLKVWGIFSAVVLRFAAPHTLIHKGVTAAEEVRRDL